jgi:glycosyltransferase involved in cell wall biosynthesis
VLTYTPKGTIYTAMALTGTAVPTIANISGLGRAFAHGSRLAPLLRALYRLALRRARCVMFQNADDQSVFLREGLVAPLRARRVPGSGVDLQRFQPGIPRTATGPLRFLMVSRLLWSKGVGEYVEAARIIRSQGHDWRFGLLGALDASPGSGVPAAVLAQWAAQGSIEYLGTTDDVRPHLEAADCVVLPSSYPEGVPRSLLEAAAMARPVITTDAPGCRDCVEDGVTGLLCRPLDAADLVRALHAFAALDADARRRMGLAGRRKMEREFDEALVIEQYRLALAAMAKDNHPA